ncbi:MAG: CARDB domain-containing protein [Pseudomonadota bacterium]
MNVTRTLVAVAMVLSAPALAAAQPNLTPGFDTKTGTVIAKNSGASDAGRSLLTIKCSGMGGSTCPDPNPVDLAPYLNPAFPNAATVKMKPVKAGTQATHKIDFFNSLPFAPGSYIFSVCVDAGDDVAESKENDNCTRIRYTVKERKTQFKSSTR